MNLASLGELIDLMRSRGASYVKLGSVEVTLDPMWKAPEKEQEVSPAVDEPPKVGEDGLTVEQQRDWYNRPVDFNQG